MEQSFLYLSLSLLMFAFLSFSAIIYLEKKL